MQGSRNLNILTKNWHTGFLYNLSKIGHNWFVLGDWQEGNRPLPPNFEIGGWEAARRNFSRFDAVIGHNIRSDLWKFLPYCIRYRKPYFQVIHGRRARGGYSRSHLRKLVKNLYSNIALGTLVRMGLVRLVFISPYARSDWPLPGTVVKQGIPVDELGPYEGTEPTLLAVGNMLHREHFAFDELMQMRAQVPLKIVGDNPAISDVRASKNWDELRSFYCRCRAYLNFTRVPEDGYNLALLEAMGSGMPVIALRHPSTPIRDGENGFLVDSLPEAVDRAKRLLADLELARRLGNCARETIMRQFSVERLRSHWDELLMNRVTPPSPEERLSQESLAVDRNDLTPPAQS